MGSPPCSASSIPGGVFTDVKSAYDPASVREAGHTPLAAVTPQACCPDSRPTDIAAKARRKKSRKAGLGAVHHARTPRRSAAHRRARRRGTARAREPWSELVIERRSAQATTTTKPTSAQRPALDRGSRGRDCRCATARSSSAPTGNQCAIPFEKSPFRSRFSPPPSCNRRRAISGGRRRPGLAISKPPCAARTSDPIEGRARESQRRSLPWALAGLEDDGLRLARAFVQQVELADA